ncbi:MAG: T9SS type A sorting domain-containing protein [Ignavibacteriaceae bacterium]
MKNLLHSFLIIITIILFSGEVNAQWAQSNGPFITLVTCMTVSYSNSGNTNIFAGTVPNGIYLSTDNGVTFFPSGKGVTYPPVGALTVSDTNLFAGTYVSSGYLSWNSGVFLSIDEGKSWTPVKNGLSNISVQSLVVSGSNLYAGTANGVFRSTNNGASWTAANNGLKTWIRCLAVSGNKIFAGTRGSGVFLSTDNGANWNNVNNGLTNLYVETLVVMDTNVFAGTDGGGVFLSTNGGNGWSAINNGLLNTTVYSLAATGSYLFAGTGAGSGGVFLTADYGASWSAIGNGNTFAANSLAISRTTLFAGTSGNGVWRRPLSDIITSIKDNGSRFPEHFKLYQNYPNPFNPTTIINYSVPKSSLVRIKVYDVLGREIETLVNEQKNPGNYKITFNAGKMASGVYFYQLRASDYTSIKKMLLLK